MTNKDKKTTDYNLEFEESTAHRDKLKAKRQGITARTLRTLVNTINSGISAYNNTVGRIPKVKKIPKINPDQTVEEIIESGGSALGLGIVDDIVKGIRRVIVPGLQTGGIFTGGVAFTVSSYLATMEFAVDKIKDFMVSGALSGLASE